MRRDAGASPSGKAPVFGTGIRRFESCRPSQSHRLCNRTCWAFVFCGRPAAGVRILPPQPVSSAVQTIQLPGRMKWPKEFPRIGPLSPAQNPNMLAIELQDFAIRQLSTVRANRRSIRVFTIRKSARPCIAFDLWRVAAGVRGAHPPNTIFHRRQLEAAGRAIPVSVLPARI